MADVSYEKYMATLQGSLEDAQRARLASIAVQVTWNLEQIRTWIRWHDYELTSEQQKLVKEIANGTI